MLKILQCFGFLTCSSHEYLHIIHLSISKNPYYHTSIYPFLSKQIRFNKTKSLFQQTSGRSTCRPFFHKKTPWRSPPWEISCFAWPFWSPYVAFPRPSWGHQLQPKHHGSNDELPWDPRRRRVSFFGGEDNLKLLKKRCLEDFECLGQLTRVFS